MSENKHDIRHRLAWLPANAHWVFEDYNEIVSVKDWRNYVLKHGIYPIVNGKRRELQAKRIIEGLVEISKKPLRDNTIKRGKNNEVSTLRSEVVSLQRTVGELRAEIVGLCTRLEEMGTSGGE